MWTSHPFSKGNRTYYRSLHSPESVKRRCLNSQHLFLHGASILTVLASQSLTWLLSFPGLCLPTNIFCLWWLDWRELVTYWVPFGICLCREIGHVIILLENICCLQERPTVYERCLCHGSCPGSFWSTEWARPLSLHPLPQTSTPALSAVRPLSLLQLLVHLFLQKFRTQTGKKECSLSLHWEVRADSPSLIPCGLASEEPHWNQLQRRMRDKVT